MSWRHNFATAAVVERLGWSAPMSTMPPLAMRHAYAYAASSFPALNSKLAVNGSATSKRQKSSLAMFGPAPAVPPNSMYLISVDLFQSCVAPTVTKMLRQKGDTPRELGIAINH